MLAHSTYSHVAPLGQIIPTLGQPVSVHSP